MSSVIFLLGIVLIPIALLIFFKINATIVFLSLCLGNVLTQFVASSANPLKSFLSTSPVVTDLHPNNNWKLLLLLLPVVISMLLLVHTAKKGSHKVLDIIMSVGVGLVGALLAVPLLPMSTAQNIVNNSLWTQLANHQAAIVSLSALICLIGVYMQRTKGGGGKHGKHLS